MKRWALTLVAGTLIFCGCLKKQEVGQPVKEPLTETAPAAPFPEQPAAAPAPQPEAPPPAPAAQPAKKASGGN